MRSRALLQIENENIIHSTVHINRVRERMKQRGRKWESSSEYTHLSIPCIAYHTHIHIIILYNALPITEQKPTEGCIKESTSSKKEGQWIKNKTNRRYKQMNIIRSICCYIVQEKKKKQLQWMWIFRRRCVGTNPTEFWLLFLLAVDDALDICYKSEHIQRSTVLLCYAFDSGVLDYRFFRYF